MTCLAKFLGRNPVISKGICRIEVHHTDFSHVQVGQTNLNELVWKWLLWTDFFAWKFSLHDCTFREFYIMQMTLMLCKSN